MFFAKPIYQTSSEYTIILAGEIEFDSLKALWDKLEAFFDLCTALPKGEIKIPVAPNLYFYLQTTALFPPATDQFLFKTAIWKVGFCPNSNGKSCINLMELNNFLQGSAENKLLSLLDPIKREVKNASLGSIKHVIDAKLSITTSWNKDNTIAIPRNDETKTQLIKVRDDIENDGEFQARFATYLASRSQLVSFFVDNKIEMKIQVKFNEENVLEFVLNQLPPERKLNYVSRYSKIQDERPDDNPPSSMMRLY